MKKMVNSLLLSQLEVGMSPLLANFIVVLWLMKFRILLKKVDQRIYGFKKFCS